MSDEALLRIEHKLDLLLLALQTQGLVLPAPLPALEGKGADTCPVCGMFQKFAIDTKNESVILTCGCKPPIRAVPGISGVGVPVPSTSRKESPDDRSEASSEDQGPVGPSPALRT